MFDEAWYQEKAQRSETSLCLAQSDNHEAFLKELPGVFKTSMCEEKNRILVVLVEHVSKLNHEETVLLRRNVKPWVIKMRYTKFFPLERSCAASQETEALLAS